MVIPRKPDRRDCACAVPGQDAMAATAKRGHCQARIAIAFLRLGGRVRLAFEPVVRGRLVRTTQERAGPQTYHTMLPPLASR